MIYIFVHMYERTNIFTVEIITAKSQNKSFISINLGVDEIRLRVMVYDVQDPRITVEAGCR